MGIGLYIYMPFSLKVFHSFRFILTGMSAQKNLLLAVFGLCFCFQLLTVKALNCNDVCLSGIASDSCNCNVKLPFRWGKRSTLRLPFRFGKRSSSSMESYGDDR